MYCIIVHFLHVPDFWGKASMLSATIAPVCVLNNSPSHGIAHFAIFPVDLQPAHALENMMIGRSKKARAYDYRAVPQRQSGNSPKVCRVYGP